jgi:thiol-disulfide isomerase/thioredoxin
MTDTTTPTNPNRLRNLLIAGVAIVLSTVFALSLKTQALGVSLGAMAKQSIPLEVALTNGKPTLMEFYADWCTSCQAMAPVVAELKRDYSDRVNFVMLNIDNEKWLPEVLSYRVDGIPHWVYMDSNGQAVTQAIGEQPREIMNLNLLAIADGNGIAAKTAPAGRTSDYRPSLATPKADTKAAITDPRAHSSQANPT